MVHPIERLRYVSRSGWAGPTALGAEAAYALADLSDHEPAAVLPACRRLLERNPSCGALWWVAARILSGGDPFEEAERCVQILEDDPTEELLDAALATGARVVRHGGVAEVATADVVVVQVDAMGPGAMVVDGDDRGLLDSARQLGVDVWVQAGVGCVLPSRLWDVARALMDRPPPSRVQVSSPFLDDDGPPSHVCVVGLDGVTRVAGPAGVGTVAEALRVPDFPVPPELATSW